MDRYVRHQRIWRVLYTLIHRLICRKFNLRHEDLEIEGPILLIPNHVSAWDPLLVAMSLPHKQVYYVASEHLFRKGLVTKLLNALVAPIPRRKAASGGDTAKAILRHLREGHSICLFAEGEQCWDGLSRPIVPATGKLAKVSGATLVTYRLEGGYLSCPRWGRGPRRGKVYGHPVGIYPPETLKAMTPAAINALIERDIAENAWDRQEKEQVRYRGRRTAEGMERALCICPGCGSLGGLRTEGDRIFCSCGFERRFTETGFFDPPAPFRDLHDWSLWERDKLRRLDFPHTELLFSDPGITLSKVGSEHAEEKLWEGTLCQYEDRLVCGDYSFPMEELSSMAVVLTKLLLFSYKGDYYELRSVNGANIRKYFELWEQRE